MMKPLIQEDDIFDHIEKELNEIEEGDPVVKVVRAIIEQDVAKFNSALVDPRYLPIVRAPLKFYKFRLKPANECESAFTTFI